MPSKQATGDKRMAQRQHRNTKLFLEDLAQQLSKTFKDAGRLRVRYNVRPNLVPIQEKLEKALESSAVLSSAPEGVLGALKVVASAMRQVVIESRDPAGGPPPPPGECWAVLERILLQPYEDLAGLMREAGLHVPQVRNFKLARSLYHAASSLMVVSASELLWTSADLVLISAALCAGVWAMEVLKSRSDAFKRVMFKLLGAISRDGEQHNVNSATWYMSSLFLLSLTFSKLPSCMGALALGVGDPAAALVGSKLGHVRLYGKKTLEGSAAFAIVSFAFFVGYMQLIYKMPWEAVLQLSAVGSLCGAVAELYCPVTVDDNLFVPVATAACVTLFLAARGDALGLPGGHVEYAAEFDRTVMAKVIAAAGVRLPFRMPDRLPPHEGVFGAHEWLYALVPAPRFAL